MEISSGHDHPGSRNKHLPMRRRMTFTAAALRGVEAVCIIALCLAAFEREAQAYVDPGSGALLLQGLMAVLFGLLFYVRKFWRLIRPGSKVEEDESGVTRPEDQ